jgi:glycosyltransferase involved in cell wall biosynthesis
MPAPVPDFTILMPTRNHGRWIEQAVRSVLDQQFDGRCELIVLDARSEDSTAEVMARYAGRLTWRREADAGQADAINKGRRLARGRIIGWLNSDDVYLPGALAAALAAFNQQPAPDFVYGDALEIDSGGNILTPNLFTEDCVAERFYTSHDYICQPTLFVRREALDRVGPLRTNLRWFLDYQWFSRFFQAGLHGRRLPQFLAANRDHPATKTNAGGFSRWWEIMQVLAENPGTFFPLRKCVRVYTLELAIKWLNATRTTGPLTRPRQALLDTLNRWFMRLVSPRSFTDIVQRYERDILPCGRNISALWSGPPPPPAPVRIEPLAPDLAQKYVPLVAELHAALRTLLFPQLPDCAGRDALLAQLLGTSVSEATYVLAAMHEALRGPGDVMEIGVAQGATSALLANELRGTDRALWLYDSFAGLPAPSPEDELKDDIFKLGTMARYQGEMACRQDEVEERLRRIAMPAAQVHIVPGFIEQTLSRQAPATVAFAYVDLDFYAPIKFALEFLDARMPPGGRVVVDDYDYFSTGARKAVDEFVARRGHQWRFTKPSGFAGHFCLLERLR